MDCAHFLHRLNDLLDARADWERDAQLQNHAAKCDQCAAHLAAWRAAEVYLAPPVMEALPESLSWDAMKSQSRSGGVALAPASQPSTPRFSWLTLAAILVLGVSAALRVIPFSSSGARQSAGSMTALSPKWLQQTGKDVATIAISQMPGVRIAVLPAQMEAFQPEANLWMQRVSDQLRQLSLTGELPPSEATKTEPGPTNGACLPPGRYPLVA